MPFQSKAQQRYMFAQHPRIAQRWAKETPDIKGLPEKIDPSKKEKPMKKKAADGMFFEKQAQPADGHFFRDSDSCDDGMFFEKQAFFLPKTLGGVAKLMAAGAALAHFGPKAIEQLPKLVPSDDEPAPAKKPAAKKPDAKKPAAPAAKPDAKNSLSYRTPLTNLGNKGSSGTQSPKPHLIQQVEDASAAKADAKPGWFRQKQNEKAAKKPAATAARPARGSDYFVGLDGDSPIDYDGLKRSFDDLDESVRKLDEF